MMDIKDLDFNIISFLIKFKIYSDFNLKYYNLVNNFRNFLIYSLKRYGCYSRRKNCKNCNLKENCFFVSLFGKEFNLTKEKTKFNLFSPDFYQRDFKKNDEVSIIINLFGPEAKNSFKLISCLYPQDDSEGIGYKSENGYTGRFFPLKGYIRSLSNFKFTNQPFLDGDTFSDVSNYIFSFQKIYSKFKAFYDDIINRDKDDKLSLVIESKSPFRLKFDNSKDIFQNICFNIFKKILYYSEFPAENYNQFQNDLNKELAKNSYEIKGLKKKNFKFYWYSFSKRNLYWIWVSNIRLILSGSFSSDVLTILKLGELFGLGRMNSFGLGNITINLPDLES